MVEIVKDPWLLRMAEQFNAFSSRVDEKIEKEQQQLKASRKKTELELKLAQEMKLNSELTERLEELSRRGSELDRVCAQFESCLTIADSDRNRLDNAKETYQVAKELTGVRLDFSAPPNVAKGYVKNESRKLLQAFEYTSVDVEALWTLIQTTAGQGWPMLQDENRPVNQ